MPSTTGSTASRWLGLGESDTAIWRPSISRDAGGAEVILHVAGALRAGGIDVAFELREDLLDVLAHDVGEHVEAAAVRHAHHHFGDIVGGGAMQDLLQDDQRGFAAFQREALLADEAGVQEMLELLGGDQIAQGAQARFAVRAATGWLPAPCAAAASASAPAPGCSCTRSRSCRNRSCAAFRGFRAAWRPACGRPRRGSPSVPVRNSRSRSQMVRP